MMRSAICFCRAICDELGHVPIHQRLPHHVKIKGLDPAHRFDLIADALETLQIHPRQPAAALLEILKRFRTINAFEITDVGWLHVDRERRGQWDRVPQQRPGRPAQFGVRNLVHCGKLFRIGASARNFSGCPNSFER